MLAAMHGYEAENAEKGWEEDSLIYMSNDLQEKLWRLVYCKGIGES